MDYLLLRDSDSLELPDDVLYPAFDRTRDDYWNHWRLASGEHTILPEIKLSHVSVSRVPPSGPNQVIWTSTNARVSATEHRALYKLYNRTEGAIISGGASGVGHIRYDWIANIKLRKGGVLNPSAIEFVLTRTDNDQLVFTLRGRRRQIARLFEFISENTTALRGLPMPDDALRHGDVSFAGAAPVGILRS